MGTVPNKPTVDGSTAGAAAAGGAMAGPWGAAAGIGADLLGSWLGQRDMKYPKVRYTPVPITLPSGVKVTLYQTNDAELNQGPQQGKSNLEELAGKGMDLYNKYKNFTPAGWAEKGIKKFGNLLGL